MSEETAATPAFQITGPADEFVAALEHAGQPCAFCDDRVLLAGEAAMRLPTDHGERLTHAACFYAVRADALEKQVQAVTEMLHATHKQLCMVLAKTGEVRVFPHQMERASQAGFSIETTNMPGGGMTLKLKGQSALAIATKMPRMPG